MMPNYIDFKGSNSQSTFGAVIQKREIGSPGKNVITDKVPYSNVKYNFSELYGAQTYGERTLAYQFSLVSTSPERLQRDVTRFIDWIYSPGKSALRDSRVDGYYFLAECITSPKVEDHGIYAIITVTFTADPFKYPTSPSTPSTSRYPDLNADGIVDANDGAIALAAAAQIGAGNPSGLTPEQEALADTDGDGVLDAVDANNIMRFAALAGAGNYTNDQAGWTRYMNDQLAQEEGII
ncbi:MAG: hypothetical protein IJN11_05660 [Oscillospiraceae bacterium]|nr:hypothetical protein [Oscillospiraceae bacterium]